MSIKSVIRVGTVLLLIGAVPFARAQRDQQDQQHGQQPDAVHQQSTRGLQPTASQQQRPSAAPQPASQSTRGLQPQHQSAPGPQPQHQSAPGPQPQPTSRSAPSGQQSSRPAPTTQRSQGPYGGAYHGGVRTNEPTNGGVHPSGVPQSQSQARAGVLQSRAGNWAGDHRTWQQRGGYNGYRIPDDRFRLYFGTGHFFHMGSLPLFFVGGYPRFQYDGYWVTMLDPWPENWPPLWYETDNLYIDWGGDGYYLYDSNYPGIALAVTISF